MILHQIKWPAAMNNFKGYCYENIIKNTDFCAAVIHAVCL